MLERRKPWVMCLFDDDNQDADDEVDEQTVLPGQLHFDEPYESIMVPPPPPYFVMESMHLSSLISKSANVVVHPGESPSHPDYQYVFLHRLVGDYETPASVVENDGDTGNDSDWDILDRKVYCTYPFSIDRSDDPNDTNNFKMIGKMSVGKHVFKTYIENTKTQEKSLPSKVSAILTIVDDE